MILNLTRLIDLTLVLESRPRKHAMKNNQSQERGLLGIRVAQFPFLYNTARNGGPGDILYTSGHHRGLKGQEAEVGTEPLGSTDGRKQAGA
jgi:hypothetical protein